MAEFNHDVPNTTLHNMKSVQDAVEFFSTEVSQCRLGAQHRGQSVQTWSATQRSVSADLELNTEVSQCRLGAQQGSQTSVT